MAQPVSHTLAANANAIYQKPGTSGNRATSNFETNLGVKERLSHPAFIIELSAQAQKSASIGNEKEGIRESQTLSKTKQSEEKDPNGNDFNIGNNGAGRREAPLSSGGGTSRLKPAGSFVDVRI